MNALDPAYRKQKKKKLSKRLKVWLARRSLPWALRTFLASNHFNGKKLIVIADDYGRLANRLIRFANLAYIAGELDFVCIDATFNPDRGAFASTLSKGRFVFNDASDRALPKP